MPSPYTQWCRHIVWFNRLLWFNSLLYIVSCIVLQCVADIVCCSVLQCVAVYHRGCNVLQSVAVLCWFHIARSVYPGLQMLSMCVRARVYTHCEGACTHTHIHICISVYVCIHVSRCTMIFVNTHLQAHHPKLLSLRVTSRLYGTLITCMGQQLCTLMYMGHQLHIWVTNNTSPYAQDHCALESHLNLTFCHPPPPWHWFAPLVRPCPPLPLQMHSSHESSTMCISVPMGTPQLSHHLMWVWVCGCVCVYACACVDVCVFVFVCV